MRCDPVRSGRTATDDEATVGMAHMGAPDRPSLYRSGVPVLVRSTGQTLPCAEASGFLPYGTLQEHARSRSGQRSEAIGRLPPTLPFPRCADGPYGGEPRPRVSP